MAFSMAALEAPASFSSLASVFLSSKDAEHEQLGRDVVVLALLGELVGDIEQAIEVLRHVHVTGRALHRGQLVDGRVQVLAQLGHVGAGLHQQRAGGAVLLVEQRREHVRGLHELVVLAHGQGLGIGQG